MQLVAQQLTLPTLHVTACWCCRRLTLASTRGPTTLFQHTRCVGAHTARHSSAQRGCSDTQRHLLPAAQSGGRFGHVPASQPASLQPCGMAVCNTPPALSALFVLCCRFYLQGVFEHLHAKGIKAPEPVGLQVMVHGVVPLGERSRRGVGSVQLCSCLMVLCLSVL